MVEMSKDILIKFINNSCSDEELALVKEWIDESDENAKELFELEQLAMHASCLNDDSDAMRRVSGKIKQRILEDQLIVKKYSRKSIYRWMSVAATVVVIAVVSIFLFFTPDVRMLKVVALNESQSVVLPDGTKVYLNTGSELKYPETFAKVRKVSLSGEGFFEVTHDAEHPFIVEGHHLNIKVLGTEFNFNSNESGENNVSLIKGSVEVCAINNTKEGVVLVPGQKADYNILTGNLTVVETNAGIDAAWHDRIIPFENASIKEIANILTQLYPQNIKVIGNVDSARTYSGVTVYYDKIDSTLKQLSHTLPIEYKIDGTTVVISNRSDL